MLVYGVQNECLFPAKVEGRMAKYTATIAWKRDGAVFLDNKYSRAHTWEFDGGAEVKGSSSPQVVPPPLSDPAGVDPEEALVAAASSCHMLWFLALARKKGLVVDSYEDKAEGAMGKGADGKVFMEKIWLRPDVRFSGEAPDAKTLKELHHAAHKECYIANSLKAEIVVEPQ